MPKFNVDITKWRKDYPFLEKIWTLYEEFNQTVDESDENKANYVQMCKQIMEQVQAKQEWYNDLCIKLIRNLGAFSILMNTDKVKYNTERCKNLNSWLYYISKNYNVPQHVITDIFNQSNSTIGISNQKHYCTNYLYKDIYNNPDDIIKLINLEEYMNELLSVLKNKNDNNHCLFRKFIFECANIYRDMNKMYCDGSRINSSTKSQTCFQLQLFKTFFTLFISTKEELKEKLPSLTSNDNEYLVRCSWTEQDYTSTQSENNTDGSILLSVPSVLGSFAGISSLLVLSYKFTPISKWLRSKQRGTTIRNILSEEEASVLLSRIPDYSYMYTHNEKYDIGYAPLKN